MFKGYPHCFFMSVLKQYQVPNEHWNKFLFVLLFMLAIVISLLNVLAVWVMGDKINSPPSAPLLKPHISVT